MNVSLMFIFSGNFQFETGLFARESVMLKLPEERRKWGEP